MDTLFLKANKTAMNILTLPSFCECAGGSVSFTAKCIRVGVLEIQRD